MENTGLEPSCEDSADAPTEMAAIPEQAKARKISDIERIENSPDRGAFYRLNVIIKRVEQYYNYANTWLRKQAAYGSLSIPVASFFADWSGGLINVTVLAAPLSLAKEA